MLVQAETVEEVLRVKCKDIGGGAAIVSCENQGEEPTYDKGIAICPKLESVSIVLVSDKPNLALASTHDVVIDSFALIEWAELFPKVDDVAIALFPIA